MNKKIKWLIGMIILILGAIILLPKLYTFASPDDNLLSATIYDTSQYGLSGIGVKLTQSGIDINDWNYTDSKFLQINTNLPSGNDKYVVAISLPKELYFAVNNFVVPTGFTKFEFEKNPNFKVNENQDFLVNEHSGTIYYTVNQGINSATIQLELKYDLELWNKLEKTLINQKNEKAINVSLYTKNDDNLNLVTSKCVNNVYSKDIYSSFINYKNYVNDQEISLEEVNLIDKDNGHDIFKAQVTIIPGSFANFKSYFKNLKVKISLPYYDDTKNGKKIYMDFDRDSIKLENNLKTKLKYNVDYSQMNNGIIEINLQDAYINFDSRAYVGAKYFLEFKMKVLDNFTIDQNFVYFRNGEVSFNPIDNMGQEKVFLNKALNTVKYNLNAKEDVVFFESGNIKYTPNNMKFVNFLGSFYVKNQGTADSNRKHFDMLFDKENKGLFVTTINLPVDRDTEYYNIKYRLVDENNNCIYKDEKGNYVVDNVKGANYKFTLRLKNTSYSATDIPDWNNRYVRLHRTDLPIQEQKYFFKEVEYDISRIKSGKTLYTPDSRRGFNVCGNFFGYCNLNLEKNMALSTMTITSDGFPTIEGMSKAKFAIALDAAYFIDEPKIDGKDKNINIEAGDSVEVSAKVSVVNYPYGDVTWLDKIVIGVVLPNGASVNNDSVIINKNKNAIKPEKIEIQDLYNGYKMYKIYIQKNFTIGYGTELLDKLESGSEMDFNLTIDTDSDMAKQKINIKDALFVASTKIGDEEPIINFSYGAYNWSLQPDKYDLNNNGKTNDKIAGTKQTIDLNFEVIPQNLKLDIKDSMSINSENDKSNIDMFKNDDLLNYKVRFKSSNGGELRNFKYYIPIPKKSSGIDNYMIKNVNNFFDLALQERVEVTGDDLYTIYYTTKTGLNINNAEDSNVNWVLAENVSDFKNVTMIKVIQKNELVQNASTTFLNVKFKYADADFNREVGNKIEFSSAGNYKYVINGRTIEGIFPTKGITINAKLVYDFPDITLTAAPNMHPNDAGNVNTLPVHSNILPQFYNAHYLRITNVETDNVTLNTKNYMINNVGMPGAYADENFSITAKISSGNEIDLLPSIYASPVYANRIGKGTNQVFRYTIYNANNLSDNSTNRYIIVTYQSENGLKLRQKIIINRELAKSNNPNSAIVPGIKNKVFDDTTKSVTISKNSSFTTQIVLNYIPNLYEEKILKFSKRLPVGTKIRLSDYVKDNVPTYWYYKVENEIDSIKLSEFKKMGYADKKYTNVDDISRIKEILLVSLDFKDVVNNSIDMGKVHLDMTSSFLSVLSSEELSFNLKDNRTFSLNLNKTSVDFGADVQLTYNMQASQGDETYYLNKKLAYVITADEKLQNDAYINYNNHKYYKNKYNQFIIPLDGVMDGNNKTISLNFNSDISSSETSFNLKVDLMVSNISDNNAPIKGEVVATKNIVVNNKVTHLPSLKIESVSNRVIYNNEIKNEQTINLKYLKIPNTKVFVELQQKSGNIYQKVNDKLVSIGGSTVNNSGVFEIAINNGDNSLKFKISESIVPGIYRLIFTVKNNEDKVIYEIPYNIIIGEELESE